MSNNIDIDKKEDLVYNEEITPAHHLNRVDADIVKPGAQVKEVHNVGSSQCGRTTLTAPG